jgi:hypothetical protein
MSTIKVIEVISRVEDLLQDTNVRWPRLELQRWINDAYLEISIHRPDANTKSGNFICAAGTRQVLTAKFPTGFRFIGVIRNTAATSNKNSIKQIAQTVLDDQRPGWHSETGTLNIQHFIFDPLVPKEFLVYPPALATTEIEVIYADTPGAHTLSEGALDPAGSDTRVINMDDIYLNSIVDFVLYRSYLKDADYAANNQRAVNSYNSFLQGIGAKTQADMMVTKTPESTAT